MRPRFGCMLPRLHPCGTTAAPAWRHSCTMLPPVGWPLPAAGSSCMPKRLPGVPSRWGAAPSATLNPAPSAAADAPAAADAAVAMFGRTQVRLQTAGPAAAGRAAADDTPSSGSRSCGCTRKQQPANQKAANVTSTHSLPSSPQLWAPPPWRFSVSWLQQPGAGRNKKR